MLKLMKYEFRKSASSKLILLVFAAVFEVAFLGGVFLKRYNLLATGMMFLILILEIAISLALSVIFYFVSGWIMEKKLSV